MLLQFSLLLPLQKKKYYNLKVNIRRIVSNYLYFQRSEIGRPRVKKKNIELNYKNVYLLKHEHYFLRPCTVSFKKENHKLACLKIKRIQKSQNLKSLIKNRFEFNVSSRFLTLNFHFFLLRQNG